MYQIVFYVPESHLEEVKQAIFEAGAGQYEHYDQCCWQVKGEGQYRPLEGSNPFLGKMNQLEKSIEYKVETICVKEKLNQVIDALIKVHPYEVPAYAVIALDILHQKS